MKTTYLFPHRFKFIGWMLLIPGLCLGAYAAFTGTELAFLQRTVFALVGADFRQDTAAFTFVHANLTYTLTMALCILGSMLVAFSKETTEDEGIAQLRLSAFQWAVFANYALLLLLVLGVFGMPFLMMLSYQLLMMIVLFIARFHYLIYINRKLYVDEK